MKNFLTKAFVCAGVLASALALSSVAAFAAATAHTYEIKGTAGADDASKTYFAIATTDTGKVTNLDAGGTTVTAGVKMTSGNSITFTVLGTATIDVSFASNNDKGKEKNATIKLDGSDVTSGENVIYSNNRETAATYSGTLTAGLHTISRGSNSNQANVYYLKVVDTYDESSVTSTDVAGTVSPANAALTGATVKSNDGAGNVTITIAGDDSITLSGSADDYISNSVSVAPTDTSFNLALTALATTDDDTNTLSTAQFNATTGVTFKNTYSVHGFEVNPTTSGGTLTNSRLQLVKDSTISYTPSSDGTLKVTGASANSTATDRGFSLTSSDTSETFIDTVYSSNSAVEKEFDLTSGNTYTIKVIGGNININSLVFEASAVGFTTDSTNHKAIYTDSTGAAYLVVGISEEDYADPTKTQVAVYKLDNGTKVTPAKKTSTKVYTSIKTTDNVTLSPGDIGSAYVYGVKVTNGTGLTLDSFTGEVE